MKRNVFIIVMALLLLVITFVPAPEAVVTFRDASESSAPEAEPDPPNTSVIETLNHLFSKNSSEPVSSRKPTTDVLKDRFVMFIDLEKMNWYDTVALWNGQEVGRGLLREVINMATGQTLGFTKLSILERPAAPDDLEYYDLNDCPTNYELYHPDGTFWLSCGTFNIYGMLGDYFYGYDHELGYRCYTTDPTDQSTFRRAPNMLHVGENLCQIDNDGESDFLGIRSFALVDSELNILKEAEYTVADSWPITVNQGTPYVQNYLHINESEHYLDLSTLEVTPYRYIEELDNGYLIGYKDDESSDLMDWEGNLILSDFTKSIYDYNGHILVAKESENSDDGIVSRTLTTTFVYRDDTLWKQFESEYYWDSNREESGNKGVSAKLYANKLYVTDHDKSVITVYDDQLEECGSFAGKDVYSNEYGALICELPDETQCLIPDNCMCGIPVESSNDVSCLTQRNCTLPGTEDMRYSVYAYIPDMSKAVEEFPGLHPDEPVYVYNPEWSNYYLLDSKGKVLQAGYDYIYETEYPEIYIAARDSRWGIIDKDGNWLWSDYIVAE